MSLSDTIIKPSQLQALLSSGFSITPLPALNVAKLTEHKLQEILKPHFCNLKPSALQKFAGKIKQAATEDNSFFASQNTTAFQMGEALDIIIHSSKWPGSSNYAVKQIQSNRRHMSTTCIFCDKPAQNYYDYAIANTVKNTSLRVSALMVHYLKDHGFCGWNPHRAEPKSLLNAIDKPQPPEELSVLSDSAERPPLSKGESPSSQEGVLQGQTSVNFSEGISDG